MGRGANVSTAAKSSAAKQPKKAVNALLIGGEARDARVLQSLFRRTNRLAVELVHASGIAESVLRMAEQQFDVIFFDLDTGEKGKAGWETLDALGAGALEIPVIALVGDPDEDYALRAVGAGAQDCMVKGDLNSRSIERVILFGIERKKHEALLKQTAAQFNAVFAASSDGLVINSVSGAVMDVNPAFCQMHGYTREEMVAMKPSDFIHPNSHHLMREFFEVVTAGGRYHCEAMDIRKDGTTFHVEVYGIAFMYKGEPHVLGLVRDITEQVRAYELLEQRVDERTREMSMLLNVSNNMTSTLELEKLLKLILEQLRYVANYDDAAIVVKEESRLLILNVKETPIPEIVATGSSTPFQNMGIIWDTLASGEAVVIDDVRGESKLARAFQRGAGADLDTTFSYIRSWLAVPLRKKEGVVGFVSLSHNEPDYYGSQHVRLITAIANQASIAIDNANLYAQAYATGRETAALAQTAAQVAFGGSLDVTLNKMCEQVVHAAGALACAIVLHDYDKNLDQIQGSYGLPAGYVRGLNEVMESGTKLIMQDAFNSRQHMVRRKMREIILERPEYTPIHPFMHVVPWDTVVAMPMVYRSKALGVLLSYHPDNREINEADITFHGVMADQAAVAVENARLLMQEHDKARLEERQRLARELHDSVTQALFSISLVARSTEVLMEREGKHTGEVMGNMADLRQLTQGALAEMRALIFELRPGALEEEGLFEAIRKHAAATQSRVMMDVDVRKNVDMLPRLKPAAEEGLYRIAQEALHNIVKHAKAKKVKVALEVAENTVTLSIVDDGIGFDPELVPAGHMGLGTMGQRAEQLGGEYQVRSKLGSGTTVRVKIPLQKWLI